jgi:hypothetical protein
MQNNIDAAVRWLCESDILNRDRDKPSFGGINNGYLWRDKKYQYVYNEITGYAINTFIAIYQWLGQETYLQYAKDAADYLISLQCRDNQAFEYGAISHSLVFPDLNNVKKYFSFDNAVILHGMVNLYRITREERYYTASLDLGNFLIKMQQKGGSFYCHYDAGDHRIEHANDEFFYDNGCLHVKNAIGLMYLDRISGDKHFYQAGERACEWGRRLLAKDGLFWANTRKKYVFTHAHCYATEGYLYAYYFSKKPEHLEIAQCAGEALIGLQNQDGSLYRIYKNKLLMKNQVGNRFEMSIKRWRNEKKYPWKTIDATSQAARIWILLFSINNERSYLQAAEKAIDFLRNNQVSETGDRNMSGGLYYQRCDSANGAEAKINGGMYTWCAQFSLSAFMLFKLVQKTTKFDDLINLLY